MGAVGIGQLHRENVVNLDVALTRVGLRKSVDAQALPGAQVVADIPDIKAVDAGILGARPTGHVFPVDEIDTIQIDTGDHPALAIDCKHVKIAA